MRRAALRLSAPPGPGPARLDAGGSFADRNGAPFVPMGVNYWPRSCGVEMWQAWPSDEIQRDLDLVADLGLNCVRWFLRWQDFETAPGRYDARMWKRLDQLLQWHRARGLWAHPALFVGFMSGGIFWPEWHRGRNVFCDRVLRRRARAFSRRAAAVCARHADVVLAIDQGNELCCLPESSAASPEDVSSWCMDISAEIKAAFPGVLVISGNEQNQVVNDTGWRFGAQRGCDLYSMHTYPVGAWHSVPFDGMTDPLGQSLLPFYVKCARAWGPVMVQEFGTLLTRGAEACSRYLRAMLPAAREAGANGFLWWCLRDIAATGHPYDKNAFEGQLGLVDAAGRVKPGLEAFLEFARAGGKSPGGSRSRAATPVALYWPKEYYPRDNPRNPGNEPAAQSRQLAIAHHALETAGCEVTLQRAPATGEAVLVIAGAKLTAAEVAQVHAWVHAGGRLIFHGPDILTWGAGLEDLLGAEPLDFGAARRRSICAFGRGWNFHAYPREICPRVALRASARLVAAAADTPLVWTNRVGRGAVAVCLANVEAGLAAETCNPARREHWPRWYRGMLSLLAARRKPLQTP